MGVKYDKIGVGYNQTRKADPFLTKRLHHHLCTNQRGTYLDVGCGTGNYTIAIAHKGIEIVGIDPSEEMLKVARSKDSKISWIQGIAEAIPLTSECVDGIICNLTIHHWDDLTKGFQELHRVLNPNGRVVLFTSTPEQMKGYWLNHYFPKMVNDSIRQMPSEKSVFSALKHAGFLIADTEQYRVKPDLEDLFLYAGKHNPLLYLNSEVRNGVSSFSSLANTKEVSVGLQELEKDITSGNVSRVIEKYSNDLGDYLYIIAKKASK